MQLGMVGLGRMGANLVRRLLRGGHRCVGLDRALALVLRAEGAAEAGVERRERGPLPRRAGLTKRKVIM